MHEVPQRRHLDGAVRIVRQQRHAGRRVRTADHPVVGAHIGAALGHIFHAGRIGSGLRDRSALAAIFGQQFVGCESQFRTMNVVKFKNILGQKRGIDCRIDPQVRIGGLIMLQVIHRISADGAHGQRRIHLLVQIGAQPIEAGYHHRRGPFSRPDVQHPEFRRLQKIRTNLIRMWSDV